jgi:tyrosine-protein kinase Etk/Wzc
MVIVSLKKIANNSAPT